VKAGHDVNSKIRKTENLQILNFRCLLQVWCREQFEWWKQKGSKCYWI